MRAFRRCKGNNNKSNSKRKHKKLWAWAFLLLCRGLASTLMLMGGGVAWRCGRVEAWGMVAGSIIKFLLLQDYYNKKNCDPFGVMGDNLS
jgi:hypothetical protein